MVNTAEQGARVERQVRILLEGCGYDCIRSAASKGAVDIVAVAPFRWLGLAQQLGCRLLFIQCKLSNPNIGPAERLRLTGLALRAGALPIVAYKGKQGRFRPLMFRELTGPGPKDWVAWEPPQKGEEKS